MTDDHLSILIVEDNADSAVAMASLLGGVCLLAAEKAGSLAEGRAAIHSRCPSHVIIDLQLPDGSGLDFLDEVRATCPGAHTVVVTASCDVRLEAEAKRRGADVFLRKPLDSAAVMRAIGLTPES